MTKSLTETLMPCGSSILFTFARTAISWSISTSMKSGKCGTFWMLSTMRRATAFFIPSSGIRS
ncbi:hypothetical protein D3C72_1807930 [compost metagenome]